eukprot:COSAG01_NODE_134_length_24525_cov_434.185172_14_plen_1413_part_00
MSDDDEDYDDEFEASAPDMPASPARSSAPVPAVTGAGGDEYADEFEESVESSPAVAASAPVAAPLPAPAPPPAAEAATSSGGDGAGTTGGVGAAADPEVSAAVAQAEPAATSAAEAAVELPAATPATYSAPLSAALAPRPAGERTFSADDTDLEALFQRTEAVASSSAERKLHRPHARAKSEKRTPTATPTKAKKKRPPQATGSALPRDLSALQGDEAAIDREIRRLQDELRASSTKLNKGRHGDLPRLNGWVPPQRKGGRRTRPGNRTGAGRHSAASFDGLGEAELDAELNRLKTELGALRREHDTALIGEGEQAARHGGDGDGDAGGDGDGEGEVWSTPAPPVVAVSRASASSLLMGGEPLPWEKENRMPSRPGSRRATSAGRQGRRRQRGSRGHRLSRPESATQGPFGAAPAPLVVFRSGGKYVEPSPVGPAWDATPLRDVPGSLRPIVLSDAPWVPHVDLPTQRRNRELGCARKPRRLPEVSHARAQSVPLPGSRRKAFDANKFAVARSDDSATAVTAAMADTAATETGARRPAKDPAAAKAAPVEMREAVTQCGPHDMSIHEGMLSVTLIKAEGLLDADRSGGGGSDPYVRVGMGGQEFATKVNKDVNFNGDSECVWNQTFVLRCHPPHDSLEIEVYDYDVGDEDDLLGGMRIQLDMLQPHEEDTAWWGLHKPEKMQLKQPERVALTGNRSHFFCGALMVKLLYIPDVWRCPLDVRDHALDSMQSTAQAEAQVEPCGKLHVRLVEARGLPKLRALKACNPFAMVSYGGAHNKSVTAHNSTRPKWDAVFTFNCFELHRELTVDVLDYNRLREDSGISFETLGSVTFDVAEELNGNRRVDSWMTLWAEDSVTSLPIARGEVRVRLEFCPRWPKGGRKGKIDSGGGQPERLKSEYAVLELCVERGTGLTPMRRLTGSEKRSEITQQPAGSFDAEQLSSEEEGHEDEPLTAVDSYCTVTLLGKAGEVKGSWATGVVRAALEPEWDSGDHDHGNHRICIPVTDASAIARVDCFHCKRGKHDHLGGFFLPIASAMCAGTKWHTKQEHHWFRLEPQAKLDTGPRAAGAPVLVDGELSRQYNSPLGAVRLSKTFGLEPLEEGVQHGVGRLSVTVLRGKKMPDIKRKQNRPPDVFAVLTYDSLSFETEINKRARSPVWNQQFDFSVSDIRSSFNVAVYDNGLLGDHQLIGAVSVGISEVLRSHALDQQPWYKLFRTNEYGKLRPNGEIQLGLRFVQAPPPLDGAVTHVPAPVGVRHTLRSLRMVRQLRVSKTAPSKQLTQGEVQAKREKTASSALSFLSKKTKPTPSSLPVTTAINDDHDEGTVELQVDRAIGLKIDSATIFCQAWIASAEEIREEEELRTQQEESGTEETDQASEGPPMGRIHRTTSGRGRLHTQHATEGATVRSMDWALVRAAQ